MKDSHLYQRLDNINAFKVYCTMFRTYELETVKEIYDNLTIQASDHPKYQTLKDIYEARLNEKGS